jgi:two-component system OmpR family response regulator
MSSEQRTNGNSARNQKTVLRHEESGINFKVLIVEDDLTLQETLAYNMRKENYRVIKATDGEEGLRLARENKPDIIILDIMLPKLSGFEVCRIIREESAVPIMMLTAKTDETDKVVGLELGADDYVTKPFSMRELIARVRAMLRRIQVSETPLTYDRFFKMGDIEIDIGRHQAFLKGSALELTPKEFEILTFLATNKGLVFDRNSLLEKIWGHDYSGDSRTIDVHIWSLRQKIEADPGNPRYLFTVRGAGYKFDF